LGIEGRGNRDVEKNYKTRSFIICTHYQVEGDQKVSVHLIITTQKVTSDVQSVPASLQTFIDTPNCVLEDRVQYSTVQIPNVFCAGHLQITGVGIVACFFL
jgi:hypothetical protein